MNILFENTIIKPCKIDTIYVLEDNRAINKVQYFEDDENQKLSKIIWTMDEYWLTQEGTRQLAINLTIDDVLSDNLPEDLYWDHP